MKKWEYTRESVSVSEEYLDTLGEQGWEAVCLMPNNTLLLKREKEDEGFGMPVIPEPHEPKAPGPN